MRAREPRGAGPPDAWSYGLAPGGAGLEIGCWSGDAAPDLAAHFHADAQLTIVLGGARTFQIGAARYTALPGQIVYIPARTPHRGLPLRHGATRCVNLYPPALRLAPAPLVIDAPEAARAAERGEAARALRALARRFLDEEDPASPDDAPPAGFVPVRGAEAIGAIAARNGMSREGFSRRFARNVGMPPHAYRLVERLNEARRRLRLGDAPAGVAAELDFADQSHLGRQFRRVFGVTPRAYRESMR